MLIVMGTWLQQYFIFSWIKNALRYIFAIAVSILTAFVMILLNKPENLSGFENLKLDDYRQIATIIGYNILTLFALSAFGESEAEELVRLYNEKSHLQKEY